MTIELTGKKTKGRVLAESLNVNRGIVIDGKETKGRLLAKNIAKAKEKSVETTMPEVKAMPMEITGIRSKAKSVKGKDCIKAFKARGKNGRRIPLPVRSKPQYLSRHRKRSLNVRITNEVFVALDKLQELSGQSRTVLVSAAILDYVGKLYPALQLLKSNTES